MFWTFLTVVFIGLVLIIGGLTTIIKTKHGPIPAIITLVGIYVAFFLPGFIRGPEGLLIDASTKWWRNASETAGYIAFVVLIATIIIDLFYTFFSRKGATLSQLNQVYGTDSRSVEEKENDERYEKIFLVIALILTVIIGGVFRSAMNAPSHILVEVMNNAHRKGYPVQLSPFIIEVPAEKFTDEMIKSIKHGAEMKARAAGMKDFTITKLYSLRFISRDNDVIDEIALIADGTYLVPDESKAPKDGPSAVITKTTSVDFKKAAVSLQRPGTKEETNVLGNAILQIIQDRDATDGSGMSSIPRSSSSNSYAPITIGVKPIDTDPTP